MLKLKLKDALIKKRKGKLHGGVLFLHNNAPAHSSRVAQNVLREFRWEVLPHPPDFFFFPKLKEILKGTHFNDIEEAKRCTTTCIRKLPPEFLKDGLRNWKHRFEKCIDLNGNYVEK